MRDAGRQAITAPISRKVGGNGPSDGTATPKLLVASLDAMEPWLVDLLRGHGFDFADVPFREARDLGVNSSHSATKKCCR